MPSSTSLRPSATCSALASAGVDVVGVEQFELGHARGASHDHSRIIRRSYHTPGYVELAGAAYDAWDRVGAEEPLVVRTGGLDLFPRGAVIAVDDYTGSLDAAGVPFEDRAFSLDEARAAREAFITSATSFVKPVVALDGAPVGDGAVGPVTRRLFSLFARHVSGHNAPPR